MDEDLRAQYGRCDATNDFRSLHFPIPSTGRTIWFGCSTDPNRLALLVRLSATATSKAAVVYSSKLGLDLDGSWIACFAHGPTDQCGTSLMLPASAAHPCVVTSEAASRCVPVDADRVPYIVIPAAGPAGSPRTEFMTKTGIGVGDVGVVVFGDHVVPVIVADTGPFNKIGEGSMALQRALGHEFCKSRNAEGACVASLPGSSIGSGVMTILFPGSKPSGLTPDTIAAVTQKTGQSLYDNLAAAYPK